MSQNATCGRFCSCRPRSRRGSARPTCSAAGAFSRDTRRARVWRSARQPRSARRSRRTPSRPAAAACARASRRHHVAGSHGVTTRASSVSCAATRYRAAGRCTARTASQVNVGRTTSTTTNAHSCRPRFARRAPLAQLIQRPHVAAAMHAPRHHVPAGMERDHVRRRRPAFARDLARVLLLRFHRSPRCAASVTSCASSSGTRAACVSSSAIRTRSRSTASRSRSDRQ